MKKILLAGINARFSHSNLALYYLRTYTQDLGFNIYIREFVINQDLDEIIDSIINENPDCICLSVYIWNTKLIKSIIPKIKSKKGNPKIILGGPEVSYDPQRWLDDFQEIDHIIIGPGEAGFRRLVESGLTLKEKIIETRNPHFSEIPFPYDNDDFESLKGKNIYYETSRGCPYKCAYCLSSRIDQKLEFKNIEQVKKELDIIIRHQPKIVKFVDRTFNAVRSHYRQIWEYLVSGYSDSGIRFHFEIYPGLLEKEDFDFLITCPEGLFQFEVGIQSTHEETLKAINRKCLWESIEVNVKRLIELKNIHIHLDLIIGLPYEDIIHLKDSFNRIYSLKADHFQLGILKVLKGTRIYNQVAEYEITYSLKAPYTIESNKWLSKDQVKKLIVIAQLIDTIYNTHKFTLTLDSFMNLSRDVSAPLYKTPYDLYNDLAEFIITEYFGKRTKVWEENAQRILKFIKTKFPKHEENIFNCLRQDWDGHSKQNFYPKIIRTEEHNFILSSKLAGMNRFRSVSEIKVL